MTRTTCKMMTAMMTTTTSMTRIANATRTVITETAMTITRTATAMMVTHDDCNG